MGNKKIKGQKREFKIHAFDDIPQALKFINSIRLLNLEHFEISVLQKLDSNCESPSSDILINEKEAEKKWTILISKPNSSGIFRNHYLGTIYVAGHLAPIFLKKLTSSNIGSLDNGPYAIFKGLGINDQLIPKLFFKLSNCKILLIVRAHKEKLKILKQITKKYSNYIF